MALAVGMYWLVTKLYPYTNHCSYAYVFATKHRQVALRQTVTCSGLSQAAFEKAVNHWRKL